MTSPLELLEPDETQKINLDLPEVWKKLGEVEELTLHSSLLYYLKSALSSFLQYPLGTVGCVVVLSVGLILWGTVLLFVSPLNDLITAESLKVPIRVELKSGMSNEETDSIKKIVGDFEGVSSVKLLTRDQVLREIESRLGRDNPLLVGVSKESNPFPDRLLVRMSEDGDRKEVARTILKLSEEGDGIQDVQVVSKTFQSFTSLLSFVGTMSNLAILGSLIGALLLVVIALQFRFLLRKQEIQIMSLVGATESFIRAPLVAEGVLLSFVSGVIALFMLGVFEQAFQSTLLVSFGDLGLDASRFSLSTLSKCLILVTGVLLGVIGSLLAVRLNLWRTEGVDS